MVPQDCFADEVAIDFPSVGRLVQRMRATFFAENPGGDVEYHANMLRSEEPLSRRLSPPRRYGPNES
ncbi:MAG: hypothetical protein WBD07_16115 [Vicinamibacterales bacterium]